jgi:copper homeostasis protein
MKKPELEICAFSVECAVRAGLNGADRVEFCSGPEEGGLTPAVSDVQLITEYTDIPLFVMIRPRAGNFVYSLLELESMKRAVRAAYLCKASGIVLGILNEDGTVNEEMCKAFVEYAKPMPCVFHRAFDETPDPFDALETIIRCGFSRILSSGKEENAAKGIHFLKLLKDAARGRIEIMAGGGVTPENAKLILSSGVDAIHSSAREKTNNNKDPRRFSGVDKEKVRELRKIVDDFRKG